MQARVEQQPQLCHTHTHADTHKQRLGVGKRSRHMQKDKTQKQPTQPSTAQCCVGGWVVVLLQPHE